MFVVFFSFNLCYFEGERASNLIGRIHRAASQEGCAAARALGPEEREGCFTIQYPQPCRMPSCMPTYVSDTHASTHAHTYIFALLRVSICLSVWLWRLVIMFTRVSTSLTFLPPWINSRKKAPKLDRKKDKNKRGGIKRFLGSPLLENFKHVYIMCTFFVCGVESTCM